MLITHHGITPRRHSAFLITYCASTSVKKLLHFEVGPMYTYYEIAISMVSMVCLPL